MILRIAQANAILLVQYAVGSLIPLLLVPHIVHVIGLEKFGRISVLMACASYGASVVQYAFHLTGPKHVMQPKEGESIKDVFLNITFAKFLLMAALIPILVIGPITLPSLTPNHQIEWLLVLAAPIASFMNSTWLLQSVGKFFWVAILGIVGSALTLLIGFSFINPENSHSFNIAVVTSVFGMLFTSFGTFIISILSIINEKCTVTISKIIETIKNGWLLFISQFISQLYTGAGPIVINQILGAKYAGTYGAMERVINALMAAALLTHVAAYPRLAHAYNKNRVEYLKILNLVIAFYMTTTCTISLTIFLFHEQFLNYLYGQGNTEQATLLFFGFAWLITGIFGPILTGYLIVSDKKNEIWPLTLKILVSSMLLGVSGVFILGSSGWLAGLVAAQSINLYYGIKHWKNEYSSCMPIKAK